MGVDILFCKVGFQQEGRGEQSETKRKKARRTCYSFNNIFISYIKYTDITPPANSKANRGRWCEDGLRFITIVEVKRKYHIYNKEGQSREKLK